MPMTFANPYDSQTPIGSALSNIGAALFANMPTAADQAKSDLARAQAAYYGQQSQHTGLQNQLLQEQVNSTNPEWILGQTALQTNSTVPIVKAVYDHVRSGAALPVVSQQTPTYGPPTPQGAYPTLTQSLPIVDNKTAAAIESALANNNALHAVSGATDLNGYQAATKGAFLNGVAASVLNGGSQPGLLPQMSGGFAGQPNVSYQGGQLINPYGGADQIPAVTPVGQATMGVLASQANHNNAGAGLEREQTRVLPLVTAAENNVRSNTAANQAAEAQLHGAQANSLQNGTGLNGLGLGARGLGGGKSPLVQAPTKEEITASSAAMTADPELQGFANNDAAKDLWARYYRAGLAQTGGNVLAATGMAKQAVKTAFSLGNNSFFPNAVGGRPVVANTQAPAAGGNTLVFQPDGTFK